MGTADPEIHTSSCSYVAFFSWSFQRAGPYSNCCGCRLLKKAV